MYNNKSFKLAIFSLIALSLVACNSGNTKRGVKGSANKTIQKEKVSNQADPKNKSATAAASSIPAWRRAASPTMTRGSKDAIFPAAKAGNLKLLKELLAEGTDVNYQNFNGETVLHVAASRGDLTMVKHLVSKGANVNVMTGKQWQPIHHAMRFEHAQVANYLIAHKASVLAKTSDGLTALALAKTSKKSAIKAIIKRYSK